MHVAYTRTHAHTEHCSCCCCCDNRCTPRAPNVHITKHDAATTDPLQCTHTHTPNANLTPQPACFSGASLLPLPLTVTPTGVVQAPYRADTQSYLLMPAPDAFDSRLAGYFRFVFDFMSSSFLPRKGSVGEYIHIGKADTNG